MKGISVFDREIKIAQLADDTMLFLEDKNQLSKALELVEQFSCASGLKLNGSKCEFMSIHDMDDIFLGGIPVKKSVKYLGIHITKNAISRHHLNFSEKKKKKTKQIFNLWLQRDISLYGRVLLSKVEGLSRFVYSALSLFVNDKAIKEINKIFLDFIWKNRPYKLKREVLANSRSEGGLDLLDFADTVNTFKVNWLRRCLMNPMSLWFFIPNNIFDKLGGLSFLLKCNLLPGKLPISLSNFCKKGPGWNDPMTAVVPRVKGFACYDLSFSRHNKNIKMEHFFLYILSRYFI